LRLTLDAVSVNDGSPADLASRVTAHLPENAGDARFYSLLGILAQKEGRNDNATRLFEQAIHLSKAEQYAAPQILTRQAIAGVFVPALESADALLRRWPGRFDDVSGALVAVFADPRGNRALMEKLADGPAWRASLLQAVAKHTGAAALLYQAILDLRDTKVPPTVSEVNLVMDSLLGLGDYANAYRLFLFTLSEAEEKVAGSVFDGHFKLSPSGKRFGWEVRQTRGLEISFAPDGGGAAIQFEDRPVTSIGLQQTLLLAPDRYKLTMTISGQQLKLPRPVFLVLKCGGGPEIARLEIPGNSYPDKTLAAEGRVPETNCPTQTLGFTGTFGAATWNVQFSGRLNLHSIELQRLGL
jgi:tetratricopeptide (TPR) repeat protein